MTQMTMRKMSNEFAWLLTWVDVGGGDKDTNIKEMCKNEWNGFLDKTKNSVGFFVCLKCIKQWYCHYGKIGK